MNGSDQDNGVTRMTLSDTDGKVVKVIYNRSLQQRVLSRIWGSEKGTHGDTSDSDADDGVVRMTLSVEEKKVFRVIHCAIDGRVLINDR